MPTQTMRATRRRVIPLPERLSAKLSRQGGCLVFTGARTWNGYGVLCTTGKRVARAHRVAYTLAYGPIPRGLHIDHLCENRACCEPSHLEAVSQRVNNQRTAARRRARLELAA